MELIWCNICSSLYKSASISNHYNAWLRFLLLGDVEWFSLQKTLGLRGSICRRIGSNDLILGKGIARIAAGFGNILALEEVGLFWFAAPALTAIGVYNPFFLDYFHLFAGYKSVVRRPNLQCTQNQGIHLIIHHSIPCCFGKYSTI